MRVLLHSSPEFQPAVSRGAWPALILCLALFKSLCSGAESDPVPASYLRIDESVTNVVRLQTAVRRMVPIDGKGPAIWLCAVTHLGSTNYFQACEQLLATNDLVLFESVLPAKKAGWTGLEFSRLRSPAEPDERSSNLQTDLAHALGLAFQLESVDYARTNFHNSDLSMEAVQELMLADLTVAAETARDGKPNADIADHGDSAEGVGAEGGGGSDGFSQLMAIMQGRGFLGGLIKAGVQIIAANPRLQATTRLTFIQVLGGLKGDLARAAALPPEMAGLLKVLIHERNEKVTQDLRLELKRPVPPASIAVFYGAGHMADLEDRVRKRLAYRPDIDVWLTAFGVDLAEYGITRWEREMIRYMTESQLKMLAPSDNE